MVKIDDIDKLVNDYNANPNSFYAIKNLAIAYRKNDEYEKAFELYSKAVEIKPNAFDLYTDLGSIYYSQKRFDLALSMYRKSLDIQEDNIFTLHKYINCYKKVAAYDIEFLQKCLEVLLCKNAISDNEIVLLQELYEKTNNIEGLNTVKEVSAEPFELMEFEDAKKYIFTKINKELKQIKTFCALLEKNSRQQEIYAFLDEEISKNNGKIEYYFIYANYLMKDNREKDAIDKIYEFMRVNQNKKKIFAYKKLVSLYLLVGSIEIANSLVGKMEKELQEKKYPVKSYEYKTLSKVLDLIGKKEEAEMYSKKAEELRKKEKQSNSSENDE